MGADEFCFCFISFCFVIRVKCITKWDLVFLSKNNLRQLDISASTSQISSYGMALLSGLWLFINKLRLGRLLCQKIWPPLRLRKCYHLKEGRKGIGVGAAAAPGQPLNGSVALGKSEGPQFPHLWNDLNEWNDLKCSFQPCLPGSLSNMNQNSS